jgi:predicted acyltransferase (DUF342 family)
MNAQSGGVRDFDTKTALAAADAAAERALYRYNKTSTTASTPCLTATPGQFVAVSGDGWCPPVSGTIGSASYSYRVLPTIVDGEIKQIDVVSTGTSDDVTRRLKVTSNTPSGTVFGDFNVLSNTDVTLDSQSSITGNLATNGSISLASNAQICGNLQYGLGETVVFDGNSSQCEGYNQSEGTIELPLVNQGDVATNNSNGRFFTQDLRSSASRVTYTAATRTLELKANSTLTLGGGNYSLCRLIMASNTNLYIANAVSPGVRIYFDSPENCNLPDGTVQMDMSQNSNVLATSGSPKKAAFLFVGSESLTTRAILSSNTSVGCNFEVIVYGPLTDITLNSNTSLCGGVAAHSIHLNSNAEINIHPDAGNFNLPLPLHFTSSRYVECTPTSTGTPDSGC